MFRFRLEQVLRLREIESDRATRELAQVKMELRRATSNLVELKSRRQLLLNEHEREGEREELNIEMLKIRANFLSELKASIAVAQERVDGLEMEFLRKKRALIEALKRENILRKLKSRQYSRYLKEEERKERIFLDEVGAQRRARSR